MVWTKSRMNRLFAKTGKCFDVAIDHELGQSAGRVIYQHCHILIGVILNISSTRQKRIHAINIFILVPSLALCFMSSCISAEKKPIPISNEGDVKETIRQLLKITAGRGGFKFQGSVLYKSQGNGKIGTDSKEVVNVRPYRVSGVVQSNGDMMLQVEDDDKKTPNIVQVYKISPYVIYLDVHFGALASLPINLLSLLDFKNFNIEPFNIFNVPKEGADLQIFEIASNKKDNGNGAFGILTGSFSRLEKTKIDYFVHRNAKLITRIRIEATESIKVSSLIGGMDASFVSITDLELKDFSHEIKFDIPIQVKKLLEIKRKSNLVNPQN